MIAAILSACVVMFWAPAPNADAYDIYKNGFYHGSFVGSLYTVCRDNYYDVDEYFVVPFQRDASGNPVFGTPSGTLMVQWVWDFDYTDAWSDWVLDLDYEGAVGWSDFTTFLSDYLKAMPRSDPDGDGIVGLSDFGRFVQAFGKCNVRPEMYQWSKVVVDCG